MTETNRSDLFKQLMAGATFSRIPAKELGPKDVIVMSVPGTISPAVREQIEKILHDEFWPDRKVLILEGGATLSVITTPDPRHD